MNIRKIVSYILFIGGVVMMAGTRQANSWPACAWDPGEPLSLSVVTSDGEKKTILVQVQPPSCWKFGYCEISPKLLSGNFSEEGQLNEDSVDPACCDGKLVIPKDAQTGSYTCEKSDGTVTYKVVSKYTCCSGCWKPETEQEKEDCTEDGTDECGCIIYKCGCFKDEDADSCTCRGSDCGDETPDHCEPGLFPNCQSYCEEIPDDAFLGPC